MLRTALVAGAAFLAGSGPAFLLGGPAFFADGPYAERYWVLLVSAGILFLLAGVGGVLAPAWSRTIALWLVAPLVPVASLLTEWDKPAMAVLTVAFVAGDVAATFSGAAVGSMLRLRRWGAGRD
jgi:hypothetical protein